MATYYVWSGATGTNAGTSWTNAYTSFASAVTAATASGDVILVHYTHQQNNGAAATYSFSSGVRVISVNKDASDAPTPMGTGGWIGSSVTAYSVALNGGVGVYLYGITFRIAAQNVNVQLEIGGSDGAHYELENCYLWQDATGSGAYLSFGTTGINNNNSYVRMIGGTVRLNGSNNRIWCSARVELESVTLDANGTKPSTLFGIARANDAGGASLVALGCDLSYCTNTLVGVTSALATEAVFAQCKFGANMTVRSADTSSKATTIVRVFDCSSGDTHGLFGYYDAFGSCVSDTGIYYTTGAAAQSWKIVTTANCSYYTPFVSPFVDFYNTGTSSITPRFEILRDGSTTAFQNDEVWGEFFVKSTSGSTQSTEYSDRMALLGTPADQAAGAGTGSWTGEGANAWSGKIDSGSAVTPAESGHIRGRVVVGEPSITVYVDPQIRT